MGKHEIAALQSEYVRLRQTPFKTQAQGSRLDQIETLLGGELPYPYGKIPPDPLAVCKSTKETP